MNTPGAPDDGAFRPLYGTDYRSINRRSLIAGAVALGALPAAARSPMRAAPDPVSRAMAAAGGFPLLSRVRAMSWSGTARVWLGTTAVDLDIETRIEPFMRSRSDTWLTSDGRHTARTVMVEQDGAYVVHEGAQTRLPDEQARFERQQFGAYAYLLLAPARVTAAGARRLNAVHDGYPPIMLTLAADGRVAGADYVIASPERASVAVRQHLSFIGTVSARGIRFPRTITIMQNSHPFMRLTITGFAVELST